MRQKKLILLLAVFTISIFTAGLYAQEAKSDTKKQEKADKKKAKEEKDIAEYEQSKQMAEDREFVFRASQLFLRDGSAQLDPRINFFYIVDDYAVIQFAFDGVFIGGNGVGGITIEGKVDAYKVLGDNPKKPVQVELTVIPRAGQGVGVYDIVVKFYGDEYGELLINSNGYRLKGQFEAVEEANIYEGNKL